MRFRFGSALRQLAALSLGVALSSTACSDAAGPGPQSSSVTIVSARVEANPNNNLSALVKFKTRNADSARLSFLPSLAGNVIAAASTQLTPLFHIVGDTGTIAALGLRENTSYRIALIVFRGGAVADTTMSFVTGQLPSELSRLRLQPAEADQYFEQAPADFILTDFTGATAAYLVVFDETGQICWYRQFQSKPGEGAVDADRQANGDYTLFVGQSTGWQPTPGRFIEVNAAGDSVTAYSATAPFTDPHELLLEYDGGTLAHVDILGYDFRQVDLSSLGGLPNQTVAGHVLLRQSPTGQIEFSWNAWNHFSISDWIFVQPGLAQMPTIDFDHPNSLIRDTDGNYIVSFASLGEITKIDATSGQMIWRFGGRHNQFTTVGDPLNGFGIQHHAHVLPNGNLLFIDNGAHHSPPESRAVEYHLDLNAHTATMVWQYRHSPALFSPFAGSAQRFENGNTLVAFGAAAQIAEVTADGTVVWESQMQNDGVKVPYFYRAIRLKSLYEGIAR
jgi:hypothetical protein